MDTSANEITKIAIPSAFSDERLCLQRRAINIFRKSKGTRTSTSTICKTRCVGHDAEQNHKQILPAR